MLSGLDLTTLRPRYILVECLDDVHGRQIEEMLSPYHDGIDTFSYRDVFYRRKEVRSRPVRPVGAARAAASESSGSGP